ncbi:MAG: hypothetical protein WCF67_18160 [Chitinophagaceae bacterium]
MTRSYYLKKDTPSITLEVNVSTIGEATTVALKKKSGGVIEKVTSSPLADGIIPLQDIGNGDRLGDSVLDVTTLIELDMIPQNLWDSSFENLVITYRFSGGIDGPQVYEYDLDDKTRSSSGKTILVRKAIRMILVA